MMWMTLLDIIIVIMAFVFVVLTDATIEEESAIIGTLLASGYRRREIVLHYLALPAIVGVVAALSSFRSPRSVYPSSGAFLASPSRSRYA